MIIHVGTKNEIKIQAVRDTLILYPKLFPHPEIIGIDVNIPIFGHPSNLKETINGAKYRAKKAFKKCDFSIGVEGGLMEIPDKQIGFMEVGVAAIYNGKDFYIGLSPAFSWPKKVIKYILSDKGDASQAFKYFGYTKEDKLGGVKGGIVGFLTDGRLTRENFTKLSIISALIYLEKPNLA